MTRSVEIPYPYTASEWKAVDDRVRGGASQSYLDVRQKGALADFSGTLDTSTLGGAGFASQSTIFECLDLSRFSGLSLFLPTSPWRPDQPKGDKCTDFTFNLKTSAAEKRPDGRLESRISFEYHFQHDSTRQIKRLDMQWDDFEATYRGRPKEGEKPLDPSHITEISIMCRSNFDKQSGPFFLTLGKLSGMEPKKGWWQRIREFWQRLRLLLWGV